MNETLNFSGKEKKQALEFLQKFPELKLGSEFEELRARILDCNVTMYKSGKLLIQGKSAERVKEQVLESARIKDELVLGIDEVGRGESFWSLVVAGVLGTTKDLLEFRDSKKIPAGKIAEKAARVKEKAGFYVIEITAKEIDSLRELGFNMNSIEANAINKIIEYFENSGNEKFRIIIDGSIIKGVEKKVEFLPKADDLIVQCAAASIIAKATREESKDKEKRKTWKLKES